MPVHAQSESHPALRRLRTGLVTGLAAALITSTSAEAAGLIRDAETESLVRIYAKPIFAAAGLPLEMIGLLAARISLEVVGACLLAAALLQLLLYEALVRRAFARPQSARSRIDAAASSPRGA